MSLPPVGRTSRRLVAVFGLLSLLLLGTFSSADDARLPPAVLKKVKSATTYLRVTVANSEVVQGSGFFGVEPHVVLTNAHVLGMLRPESRRPLKIEVVVNSGEATEKTYAGEVLGVDRSSDLAVLRVAGKDKEFPEPLKVASAN